MDTVTRGASAGGVVEALLDASRAPVSVRRARVDAALERLATIPGIVGAHHLDDGDEQDRACLDDLVPDLGALVSSRRFVRPRHDLTPASAERLRTPGASVFAGFTDVAFDRRWGALVVGLDDTGARRVSQFDRLHQVGSIAGWIARSTRSAPAAATDADDAADVEGHRDGERVTNDPWAGAVVDLVGHAVVFHLVPDEATMRNERALAMQDAWRSDTGTAAGAWDPGRFLRAHGAPDGRTAPEIIRVGGLPTWWRRTTVLRADGGAILGMLTEFGPLDKSGLGNVVADASTSDVALDRARAAVAAALPSIDDDERAVVEQVLRGRKMSTAARELHMGERRARDVLRSVLGRLDPVRQAELAVLVRRTTALG